LVLSVSIFEGQVNNKDGYRSNICLDYQPFYTLFKIVALVILDTLSRKYRICLLLKHGNFLSDRVGSIFAFNDVIVAKAIGNNLRLTGII